MVALLNCGSNQMESVHLDFCADEESAAQIQSVVMALFSFLTKKEKVKGLIGYFGLADWWLSVFSEQERQYIKQTFRPLGTNPSDDSLTSRDVSYSNQSVVSFLSHLAGWFGKKEDRTIAYRIFLKAEELTTTKEVSSLDIHFLFHNQLTLYYKDRENPESLDMAIHVCRQQISIADKAVRAFQAAYNGDPLPGHKGYSQLAITLERQKHFDQAIELYSQAMHQGWGGNWEKNIQRCKKKILSAQLKMMDAANTSLKPTATALSVYPAHDIK